MNLKNKWLWIMVMVLAVILVLAAPVLAESELTGGKYYTIVDEQGKVITQTGLQVTVGDEYIAPNNAHYRVTRVVGYKAYATYLGKVSLPLGPIKDLFRSSVTSGIKWLAAANKPLIGVYHTHDDESYTPSDGKDSIDGNGGIYKVGSALTSALKNQGLRVIHDFSRHDPHDPNAYHRSRRTAMSLLRKGAFSLIDVHRDAAPAEAYNAEVQGKSVAKIKLVVGRSNPRMATNLDFAKRMKAQIDKDHPGLSAGIFIGHGNYNQDLSPRAMLIEVGGDKNNRQQAEQAVKLFATSVPRVLGVAAAKPSVGGKTTGTLTATRQEHRSNYGTAIGIVIVLAIVVGAFFMINRGKVR